MRVRFSISETLKGEKRSDLRVSGIFIDQDDYKDMPVPWERRIGIMLIDLDSMFGA